MLRFSVKRSQYIAAWQVVGSKLVPNPIVGLATGADPVHVTDIVVGYAMVPVAGEEE